MAVTINPAKLEDAAVLAQLGAVTFYDTFRPYNSEEDMNAYISKAYHIDVIIANLNNPNIHYAIAFENEQAVGYIKLLLDATHAKLKGSAMELEKIYVQQATLGTGVGRMLMTYAIDHVHKYKADCLFLGVWNQNERAVTFYRKAGFEVFDTRTFQLGSRMCEDYMMVYKIPPMN